MSQLPPPNAAPRNPVVTLVITVVVLVILLVVANQVLNLVK